MKTLVIDTATKACSVALFDGDNCVAAHHEIIGRGHAEKLVPFIAQLPDKGRAEKIAVNVGPGSFTGIRVGIAAAKALALAWNAECTGYGCLSLVAAMTDAGEPVDAVMNGGHGEYFFQSFDADGAPLGIPLSMKPEDALAISTVNIIAGDAAEQFVEARGSGLAHVHLPDARIWARIAHIAPLAASALYCRAPDAQPAKTVIA